MSDYATKKDVEAIVTKAVDELSEVISGFASQVDDRFNKVDEKFNQVNAILTQHTTQIRELQQSNSLIITKLDNLDDRLLALENDIKEIYKMLNIKQDKLTTKSVLKLKGAEREQYIIDTYKMIVQIAKESHIKLPN